MRYQNEDFPSSTPNPALGASLDHASSSIPSLPISGPMIDYSENDEVMDLINDIKNFDGTHINAASYIAKIADIYLKKTKQLGRSLSGMASTFTMQKQSGLGVTESEYLAKGSYTGEIEKLRGEIEVLSMAERLLMRMIKP